VDGGGAGSAQINTSNTEAHGVFIDTDAADPGETAGASIINFGTITTGGTDAHAVNLLAVDTTFVNQGNLDATGTGHGIFIEGGRTGARTTTINGQNLAGAGIVIRNSGQIQATGAGAGIAISPISPTKGVTIENMPGGIIDGIVLSGDAAKIINEGTINFGISDTFNESGVDNRIEIINQVGATINSTTSALLSLPSELTFRNDGDINVTGLNTAGGIVVGIQDLNNPPAPEDITRTNVVTITNTGNLTVDGTVGIFVGANTTATVNNSGQITAASGIAGLGDGTFNFTNSGTINTTGVDGTGINLLSVVTANINNSGMIQTSGADATGILAIGSSTVGVSNSGSIATIGADAIGIRTLNNGIPVGPTNITNDGFINTTGVRAHGIWATEGAVTINNTNGITVDGTNASAVFVDTDFEPVTLNLTNSGTLSAPGTAVSASNANDVVNNIGTIQGAVLLFGGDDRVTLQDSSDFQGLVDGGTGGTDKDFLVASISSAKSLNGSNFVNFEDFTKDGAGTLTLTGQLDLGATGAARIQGGEFLLQAGSNLISDVTVSAGAAISGAAATVTGDIAGNGKIAPGLSPGQLDVIGNVDLGGLLEIEIAGLGAGEFDLLNVTGDMIFQDGAGIDFLFTNGFAPQQGDIFDFLLAASIIGDLDLLDVNIFGLQGGFQFDLGLGGAGLTFTALNDGVSTIPLPPAVWLFASALGLLGWCRHRFSIPAAATPRVS
jgi:hypothetical protein